MRIDPQGVRRVTGARSGVRRPRPEIQVVDEGRDRVPGCDRAEPEHGPARSDSDLPGFLPSRSWPEDPKRAPAVAARDPGPRFPRNAAVGYLLRQRRHLQRAAYGPFDEYP